MEEITENPDKSFKVEVTDEEIPFHLLGPENPIRHHG